jgi:hypothetical protein
MSRIRSWGRAIRRLAVLGTVLALAGGVEAGGITAPGFHRVRLFNGTKDSKITEAAVAYTVHGMPMTNPTPLNTPAVDPDRWAFYQAANPVGSVEAVALSLKVNGVAATYTASMTLVNDGDTLCNFDVILVDGAMGATTLTGRDVRYVAAPMGGFASWQWHTTGSQEVAGAGGATAPTLPVPEYFFRGFTVLNGSRFSLAPSAISVRCHGYYDGFIDVPVQLPTTITAIGAGERFDETSCPAVGKVIDLTSLRLSAVATHPMFVDPERQVFGWYAFLDASGMGGTSTTITHHAVVHRSDALPFWEFR